MPYILIMAIASAVVSLWANLEGYHVWPSILGIFSGVLFSILFDMHNARRIKKELTREDEEDAKVEGNSGITDTEWHFDEKDKLHTLEIDPDAVKFIAVDEAEEEGDNDE